MKTIVRIAALAVVAALGSTATARAEFFEFSGTVTLSSPLPAGATVSAPGTSATYTSPAGQVITLAVTPSTGANHLNGQAGTTISFGSINTTVPITAPRETGIGFDFTYTLTFTDFAVNTGGVATGTGTIIVSGMFRNGTIGAGQAINLGLPLNYATNPASGNFTAGTQPYNLSQLTYSGPSADGSANGTFGGFVAAVPEPASVALIGVGGLGMLLALRRRATRAA